MPRAPSPRESSIQLSRRSFLVASASFAAVALGVTQVLGAARRPPRFSAYPFQLGVASGDPAPDGVVLWTRLAPRPQETGGGMGPAPVEVSWQVAEDEALTRIVRQGKAIADPAWAHSVHVEVAGLRPGRWYWYRFAAGGEVSPKGRTRTLPPVDSEPDRLRFAFASCQKYESGFFTAYEHMAREDLDLICFLGDYIYENPASTNVVRRHGLPEAKTLDDYRRLYAVYKMDPALQAAHALAPWIVTWDDHEVSNDYANDIPERPGVGDPAAFLFRRAAAYRAYYEHMPLRRSALPEGPALPLYRRLDFGRLTRFHVLDTRQYRTDQPPGLRLQQVGPRLLDSTGTLLGPKQLAWLFDGLDHSPTRWNVLVQQVLMARVDAGPGSDVLVDVDKWAGYEYERQRVLRHFHEKNTANPIVLSGDIHSNWANELTDDLGPSEPSRVAVEFVGTSISSGTHGYAQPGELAAMLAKNPHVKFYNGERGYVRCEVTSKSWRTDFQTVPYVNRPDAPLNTRASFLVEEGSSRLIRL